MRAFGPATRAVAVPRFGTAKLLPAAMVIVPPVISKAPCAFLTSFTTMSPPTERVPPVMRNVPELLSP